MRAVPQLSGRGLGHTGGTLDKLEAIPGWRASLSNEEMLAQLEEVGAVICAAGSGLAPADKKLYALRDVTGTVESIPMISASIMSKKIAEGTQSLVLDVKTGAGAFMKRREDSQALARTMVEIGKAAGVNTVALITAMDTPLGRTAGNGLEVAESVEVLAGGGPSDVRELTLALATEMLACAGLDADPAQVLDFRQGHGHLEGDDPRPGWRPGRPTAARPAHRGDHRSGRRLPDQAGRHGGRSGRLAAGGRPGQAGRPGAGRGRDHLACRRRRSGHGRTAAVHPCTPTRPSGSSGPSRPSRTPRRSTASR